MPKKILFITFAFVFTSLAWANKTVDSVQRAYYDWCHTIGTAKGDGAKMVAFYAKDATLHPTLSDQLLSNKNNELTPYFNQLTSYKNIECIPESVHTRIKAKGKVVINSGFYRFSYINAAGEPTELPARFTFVYKKEGKKWLIVDHHSSGLPQ